MIVYHSDENSDIGVESIFLHDLRLPKPNRKVNRSSLAAC